MPYAGVTEQNSLGATLVAVKTSTVFVAGVHAINTSGDSAYLQMFDASATADVTLGTTVPRWTLSTSTATVASEVFPADGLTFENGLVAASTTTPTGTVTATQHVRFVTL